MKTIVIKDDTYFKLKRYRDRVGAKSMDEAIKRLLKEEAKSKLYMILEYKMKFGLNDEEIKSLEKILGDISWLKWLGER